MKKSLILASFIFLMTTTAFSQFTDFNLSDFKLPDIKRQSLDLNTDMKMGQYYRTLHSEGENAEKSKRFNFANANRIIYSLYKNTERIQREQFYDYSLSPDWKHFKDSINTDNDFNLNTTLNISSINRIYFNKRFFFEPDLKVSGNYGYRHDDSESADRNDKRTEKQLNIAIPLRAGTGRIEQVQDARLAIYILEDLQKNGRLSRVPDKNEILEFAAFIAKLKNERFFDYRLKRIEEMEKIDSFMQARSWITTSDARYFTTVYDNWEYADSPVRSSGHRLSAGIVPELSFNLSHEINKHTSEPIYESDLRSTNAGITLLAEYASQKPANLYWQTGWNARLSYTYHKYFNNDLIQDRKDDYSREYVEGMANYNVGYYPNSRTYLNMIIAVRTLLRFSDYSENNIFEKEKIFQMSPYISVNLYYYLSPKLKLLADYFAEYNYSNYDQTNTLGDAHYTKTNYLFHRLNIGFIYSIF